MVSKCGFWGKKYCQASGKFVSMYMCTYTYMYMPTHTHTYEALNLKISYPRIRQAVRVALIKIFCHTGSNWKSLFQVFTSRKFRNIATEGH